jgi:hypothetical protein
LFEVLHSAGGVVGVEEAKGVVRELGSVGQLVDSRAVEVMVEVVVEAGKQ